MLMVCQDFIANVMFVRKVGRTEGVNRRLRPSVQLFLNNHAPLWIDCGPDWYVQMEQAKVRFVQHMLITHGHFDHIGGLPQWYDQCRYVDLPAYLYAAAEVLDVIKKRGFLGFLIKFNLLRLMMAIFRRLAPFGVGELIMDIMAIPMDSVSSICWKE